MPIGMIGGPLEKRETLSPGLLRQRRNLMALSLFLIAFDFAKVSIAKVSILGTELVVGEPRVLAAFAWLIWAYFLLRYYQYLRDESDLSIKTQRFWAQRQRHADAWAKNRRPEGATYAGDNFLEREGLHWNYCFRTYKTQTAATSAVKIGVPILRHIGWLTRAGYFMTVQTSYFTDFVLPFLVAAAAPIVTVAFQRSAQLH